MRWKVKLRATVAWLAIAVAGVGACSEEGETAGATPSDGFCERLVDLYCDAAPACNCFEETEDDRQLCEDIVGSSCRQKWQHDVDEGYQAWDSATVEACLSAASAAYADCDSDVELEAECEDVTYGVAPAGGACDDSDHCANDLHCIENVCSEPIPPGEPCPSGYGCERQHYCGDDGLCRPCEPLGAACEPPEYGSCCAAPLYCEPATNTCQPEPGPLPVGSSCVPYASSPPYCETGLFCSSATDTCQPVPTEGEACQYPGMLADCESGLYCAEDGVCRPLLHMGDPCVAAESCASRHCVGGVCDSSLCPHG
jgi:hypothetical protein